MRLQRDLAQSVRLQRQLSRHRVSNWAGNQACTPTEILAPSSTAEVSAIVGRSQKVKVVGSGHSFTGTAMTSGALLTLNRMNRVLAVDRSQRQVTVQAGIRLRDLNRALADAGLALPNLGDIDEQSIAGATATATHGTGSQLGNLATTIVAMELVTGTGDIVRASPDQNPDIWRLARVGLGALGVVTELTLQCVPQFNLHAVEALETLDDVLDDFVEVMGSSDNVDIFWVPGARRARLKRINRTDEPLRPQSGLERVRDKWIAENLAFGTICRVGRRFPSLVPKTAKLLTSGAPTGSVVDRSDRVLCSPRKVKFVEMEYGIAIDAVPEAVRRIRDFIPTLDFPPLFPVEIRTSAGDDIALSTAHGRDTGWVAIHQYRGAPYEEYFHGVEKIMDDYNGRPHWGKLHYQSASTLRSRYDHWDDFVALRERLDPNRVFANDYLNRVLG